MAAVPADTADTMPEALTVATEVGLLLQVPPDVPVASLKVVEPPVQAERVPVIAPAVTAELTVTAYVVESLLHAP